MLTWLKRDDLCFPPPEAALREPNGLLAAGGDLSHERLLAAYRDLFEGEGVFAERLDRVEQAYADLPEIMEITAFIRDGGKRPLCLPGAE